MLKNEPPEENFRSIHNISEAGTYFKQKKQLGRKSWWGVFIAGMLMGPLANAQEAYQLQYSLDEADFNKKNYEWLAQFPDTSQLLLHIQDLIKNIRSDGHLEASVDRLESKDSIYTAYLHIGPVYEWAQLYNGNVPREFLPRSFQSLKKTKQRPFNFNQIVELRESILQEAEQNGYPFASVYLDSIRLEGKSFNAGLFIDLNQAILWGDLELKGDADISTTYLSNYLGIKTGEPYDLERLQRINRRLRELPFLQVSKDPAVSFQGPTADVQLDLRKRTASRFDFIIGFLPNSQQLGRFLLTGSFEGELQNTFGQGERIYAKFEQLRPESQFLAVDFNLPYLFNLPFGTDFSFQLYKRDTTFLDLEVDAGVQYLLEGGNYLKVFWSNRSSRLLAVNNQQLLNTRQLPPQLDVSYPAFGLEWLYQRLDYRFNPRKGWMGRLKASVGTKKISRNNKIEELELGFLYDSLELRSSQYRLEADLEAYLPIFTNSTLKLGMNSSWIFSDEPIYINEQFRLGGNRLLRGFDEEQFFATQYVVGTLEYRLLIGPNSFLYLFGDYGWLANRTATLDEVLQAFGFGSGISFETKVGIFAISLAVGTLQGMPIDFSSPKVHFGYLSRF
jgi:outer membrane protein assembly factor BamA